MVIEQQTHVTRRRETRERPRPNINRFGWCHQNLPYVRPRSPLGRAKVKDTNYLFKYIAPRIYLAVYVRGNRLKARRMMVNPIMNSCIITSAATFICETVPNAAWLWNLNRPNKTGQTSRGQKTQDKRNKNRSTTKNRRKQNITVQPQGFSASRRPEV